jgi:hypothetical protein
MTRLASLRALAGVAALALVLVVGLLVTRPERKPPEPRPCSTDWEAPDLTGCKCFTDSTAYGAPFVCFRHDTLVWIED